MYHNKYKKYQIIRSDLKKKHKQIFKFLKDILNYRLNITFKKLLNNLQKKILHIKKILKIFMIMVNR